VNKLPTPTEDQECYWLVEYLDILKNQGKITMYSHIPNETFTKSWSVKLKNKKKGVSRGFPDYVILTPKQMIIIEMKRIKGGVTSDEQREWLKAFKGLGHVAEVCYGFEEAKLLLKTL
jgi:hypothetical protein